jgi:Polyketide cyclase / dehydrase and lipid transport
MRIIRFAILSLFICFFIVTIISLFIPSQVRVSRAVQINAPVIRVLEELSDPANWRHWYPGGDSLALLMVHHQPAGLVLDQKKSRYLVFSGKHGDEVTAVYSLQSREIPTGWVLTPSIDSNSVTVQWYMEFHLRWYPWEKFSSFMFEKLYHPQLQEGLDNLKARAEK